jgi:hypothetical protein
VIFYSLPRSFTMTVWLTRKLPTPTDAMNTYIRLTNHEYPSGLQVLSEDPDTSTWTLGLPHSFYLRMTLHEEASERQQREIRLRFILRAHLTTVRPPLTFKHGYWREGLSCALESKPWGVTAEAKWPSDTGMWDLGQMLLNLRRVRQTHASAIGIPMVPPRSLDDLRRAAGEAAEELVGARDFHFDAIRCEKLLAFLYWHPAKQLAAPERAVLVNNNIKAKNIFVSEQDGRVTGLRDWKNAILGDPAEDIAGIAISLGADMAVYMARMAQYHASICLRGLSLARCDTLIRVADRLYGYSSDSDDFNDDSNDLDSLRRQLTLAWVVTQVDPPVDLSIPSSIKTVDS